MRKFYAFLFAAVATMGLAACSSDAAEDVVPPITDGALLATEFTVSLDDTRTQLDAAAGKTVWCADDKISINGAEFTMKELSSDNLTATFTGEVAEAEGYLAVYPYTEGVSVDVTNQTVSGVEVPATQALTDGSFAEGAAVAVGYTTGNTIAFKNVVSVLKFQVAEACSTVTISSDDYVAGTVTVAYNDGEPTYTVENGSNTLTLTGNFVTGETYYAAILPGTKANFVVRLDGYFSKKAASVEPLRSTLMNMKELPAKAASEWEVSDGTRFYATETDELFVAKNVKLAANKFCLHKVGDTAWQAGAKYGVVSSSAKSEDTTIGLYTANWAADITINNASTTAHDIYFDKANSRLYVLTVGKTPAEIAAPTHSNWYNIAGTMNNWGNYTNSQKFVYSGDDVWHLVIDFAANAEFKVQLKNGWSTCYGHYALQENVGRTLSSGSDNAKIKTAGTYEIWVLPSHSPQLYMLKK